MIESSKRNYFFKYFYIIITITSIFWGHSCFANVTCQEMLNDDGDGISRIISIIESGAIVSEIDLKKINVSDFKKQMNNPSYIKDFVRYKDKTARVRQFISENYNGPEVKTVLYPASGYDGAMPFKLFEKAEIVIGVDNHPFIGDLNREFNVDYGSSGNGWGGYTVVADIDRLGSTAETIIGQLMFFFPAVRLRRVLSFQAPGYEKHESNGIIEFDTGPGTFIRKYIHIQSSLPAEKYSKELSDWIKKVFALNFNAVVFKASMSTFFETSEGYGEWEGNYLSSDFLSIINHLSEKGGLLLNGDGKFSTTQRLNLKNISEFSLNQSFGYASEVQMFTF